MKFNVRLLPLLGNKPEVGLGQEQRTFLKGKGSSLPDPKPTFAVRPFCCGRCTFRVGGSCPRGDRRHQSCWLHGFEEEAPPPSRALAREQSHAVVQQPLVAGA